jgi:hypothetical protein
MSQLGQTETSAGIGGMSGLPLNSRHAGGERQRNNLHRSGTVAGLNALWTTGGLQYAPPSFL